MATSRFGGKPQENDPTKIPPGLDSLTYFAPLIPDEVRAAVPLLHQTSLEVVQSSLAMVVKFLESTVSDAEFIEFQTSQKQHGEEFGSLVTGLCSMIRIAISSKSPLSKLTTDLTSMNVPVTAVTEIVSTVSASRLSLEGRALENRSGFPGLHKLRWRIDVTISSSSLSRIMRPSILFQVNKVFSVFLFFCSCFRS